MTISKEEFETLKSDLETIKLLLITAMTNKTFYSPQEVFLKLEHTKSQIEQKGINFN